MATYLGGRRFMGLAVCALGMLFHPIMGLCSAVAIGLAMCLEDRRWLWAGLAAIVAVTIAGLLHLPLADRIVTLMDPAWRAVVEVRSPILFPAHWSIEAWSRLAVHACTLAAGAFLLKDAPRRLALGALIAGLPASQLPNCSATACRCCCSCKSRPGGHCSRWPCWPWPAWAC
jgi:hypothetical protein